MDGSIDGMEEGYKEEIGKMHINIYAYTDTRTHTTSSFSAPSSPTEPYRAVYNEVFFFAPH